MDRAVDATRVNFPSDNTDKLKVKTCSDLFGERGSPEWQKGCRKEILWH